MTQEQLGILIPKYLSGTATPEEKLAVEEWYQHEQELEVFIGEGPETTEQELHDKILGRLRTTIQQPSRSRSKVLPLWKKMAAAAAVMLVLSVGTWYLLQDEKQPAPTELAQQTEIPPGFDQAVLTTSDGRKIELGKNKHAPINEQNGVTINNNGNQLLYNTAASGSTEYFNTLEVPRKGMYSIGLADGTKVWLNALSSLRYPTTFPGKERRVSIKGEAYFEIAKNAKQPFIVEVEGGQEIEVLGTSFNVNAYTNESIISTTLLSGSVKVKANAASQLLSPGEQAQYSPANASLQLKKDIDANDAIEWKNGNFVCNGKDLKAILRQVVRWYDIEVVYQGNIQSEIFVGTISRNMNLSELLKVLEITGVHFSLRGRQLTVLP
ncbi:MAG: FecR family protein [Pseudobacter sp.]|uniref:FecR family protein n=1 Tax=Pseudobacter sp. TaxID=2045420 RepID=UPI003F822DA8